MTRSIAFISLLALALGVQHALHYARYKRLRTERRRAIQTWEGEGGAVPTGPARTAAQVTPEPTETARL